MTFMPSTTFGHISEFYSTIDLKDPRVNLKTKLKEWEYYYNYLRPHSSLNGKTPYKKLKDVISSTPDQFAVYENYMKKEEPIKILQWEKFKKINPIVAKFAESTLSQEPSNEDFT